MSKFVCPYCFEKVDTRDILFRCINPSASDCPMEEDPAYSRYWRFTTNQMMQRTIKPDIPIHKKITTHAICPHCGTKSTKIICPRCHNELPYTVGRAEEYMIALIGAKQAGKSHYVAVLINALAQHIGQKLNASLIALNEETIQRYREEFYKPIYDEKIVIEATRSAGVELKHPLMYRFSIEKRNIFGKTKNTTINLVFFDTAGEDLTRMDVMRREIKYIANSSGIIFILDPLQIPAVRDRVPKDTPLPDEHTQPEEIVTRVINLIREEYEMSESKIEIPVALTFSKIDALKPILPPDISLNYASPHEDKFDIDDFEVVSGEMQAHLQQWVGPGLNNIVDHNFNNYAYFGLSALGAAPTEEGSLTENVSSLRIEDPFLWLLWKNGLVKGERNKK
ncbi:MAG: hypothetical protein ACOC80_12245 [Petrotogales bacterium]